MHDRFRVPKHVIAHMEKVAYVCEVLAKALVEKGEKIDVNILVAAALLHDVLRVCDFRKMNEKSFRQKISKEDRLTWKILRKKYGHIGHEKAMEKILLEMGEKELANLVSKHDFWRIDHLKGWEEKILYYADKRVEADKIVSLKERFKKGVKRNAKKDDDQNLRKNTEKKTFELEKSFMKIFGKLPI